MAKKNTITHAKKAFKHQFDAMVPLILSEWPQLLEDNLRATKGDLELAVDYISGEVDHTKTRVRRHLDELAGLIEPAQTAVSAIAVDGSTSSDSASSALSSSVDLLLNDLEARTEHLIAEFKAEMLPELEKKARSNLGTSLLVALGLGFILGLLLGGKRD
ncbi:hypothetical protein IQ265_23770 [Nodosilinea sp. LEGE 06152]|uniref:hypothetical protein n=1 Tax=Nodosilinea sp. LEGE 06152 TaxID=2777966 RepID=UPI0018822179|nr:hypothetical protein [Nodosilinea sp. LEGE 06152]MBE9159829.1 hypothetical protein [Nodosilinea sp. LEGE 06152]